MIISKIIDDNIVCYNLHAEQTVTATFLDEAGIGVFEESLTNNTLGRIIGDFSNHPNFNLILDFKNLKSCQNNLLLKITELIKMSKISVLKNVKKEIVDKLGVKTFTNVNNIELDGEYALFYLINAGQINISNGDLFNEAFKKYLVSQSHNDSGPIPHHSSSVYLTTYIDIKGMISKEKGFFIYSLYHLAMRIKNHWDLTLNNEKPTLVCQNLNGSYIASILSGLLKMNILILDKLGPINKLYSTLDNKIEDGKSYIVVSDVVCLGTEIKIAKNLITFLGGNYLGNVSVIRVETLLPETKKFDDNQCIFKITRDNNPINFQIKTALNLE